MIKWINKELIEVKYDKLDYWIMYLEGDLSFKELKKLIK